MVEQDDQRDLYGRDPKVEYSRSAASTILGESGNSRLYGPQQHEQAASGHGTPKSVLNSSEERHQQITTDDDFTHCFLAFSFASKIFGSS